MKTKMTSLADKISSLVTAAPTDFGSDDEDEETKAKLVEHHEEGDNSDEDLKNSSFRRKNVDLLDQIDKRYVGKKVSRKDIKEDDTFYSPSDDSSVYEESNDEIDEDKSEADKSTDLESEDGEGSNTDASKDRSEETNSEDETNSEIDEDNPLRRKTKSDLNFRSLPETNIRAEVEKGNCVRSQLKLWESLLEMRIKLQKCLVTGNKMPQYDVHEEYRSDATFTKSTNDTKDKLTNLLDNTLRLQDALLKNYPETKNLINKGGKKNDNRVESADLEDPMDEEIPSDTEDEMEKEDEASEAEEEEEEEEEGDSREVPKKRRKLADYEKILADRHEAYAEYRRSVIQKWNDKTQVAAGNVSKSSKQSVVKQIDFVLNDKSKLLKRSQLKRSEYEIVGKPAAEEDENGRRIQEYDSEIYDDDDFYHQLLKELIEYKSADITDPVQLGKQWVQLQNMRSKMKRKIDTKATKGRRLRYNVHTKLVNYMAPITVNDTWTELAKNELYNSLFGKIKSAEANVEH